MATNSGSGNPLGIETGPVTSSPPPVNPETLSKIKKAASDEVLRSGGNSEQAGNDNVAEKAKEVTGVGYERTK